jgi:hypothetical protein
MRHMSLLTELESMIRRITINIALLTERENLCRNAGRGMEIFDAKTFMAFAGVAHRA